MAEAKVVEQARGSRTRQIGTVVSSKMDRSVVVRVDRTVKDKLYKRYVRHASKFMAHDENNVCKLGDQVEIVESRPLSKNKRWRVRRIVRSSVGAGS